MMEANIGVLSVATRVLNCRFVVTLVLNIKMSMLGPRFLRLAPVRCAEFALAMLGLVPTMSGSSWPRECVLTRRRILESGFPPRALGSEWRFVGSAKSLLKARLLS